MPFHQDIRIARSDNGYRLCGAVRRISRFDTANQTEERRGDSTKESSTLLR